MDIENYPFINPEEFAEACHHLDSQYCRATLGPLRKRWKLKVCTALDLAFSTEGGYTTYIQIVRPLEIPGDLDLNLDSFTISPSPTTHDIPTADNKMIDDESDEAAIVKPTSQATETVTYEIHRHPTYRVPCLWFSLHGLPPHEPAFNIDTIFRRLVPDEYKEGLRGLGGIGGISADVSFSNTSGL
ncbi:autophagy-related protein Atg10 [Metarhizium brunneum]